MEEFEIVGVSLEVGKEVGTITETIFEVPQDRGLETEAQTHEVIELESEGEEEVQELDEERINVQDPKVTCKPYNKCLRGWWGSHYHLSCCYRRSHVPLILRS